MDKKADLTAERFYHLEQVFVGARDSRAEQLEDARDLSLDAQREGKGTVQPRFDRGCGARKIVIARDIANPCWFMRADYAPR